MSGQCANRRRRLLLWSALPVVLALALAAKLLATAWFGGQAAEAFARADAPAAESAASALTFANVLEPHKAPFAAGDAFVLRGDYTGARAAFEAALAGAPPEDECRVRVNLALSIERLSDAAAARIPDAVRLLDEALAVVKASPDGCFDRSEAGGGAAGDAGELLRQAETRLDGKLDKLRNQTHAAPHADSNGASQAPPTRQPAQLEQLRESGKSAQQERNRGLQREEYLNGSSAGPLTDKPW